MGDNTSDQDTFVSIEHYAYTPQPIPSLPEEETSHPNGPPHEEMYLSEDVYAEGNPQNISNADASPHPRRQSAVQMEDHSSFMWNLYAPESRDVTVDLDADHTLEVPGDVEDTPDPSDLCGEFNTSAMKRKPFARNGIPRSHPAGLATSSQYDLQSPVHKNSREKFSENLTGGKLLDSAGASQDRSNDDKTLMKSDEVPCPPHNSSPEETEEVLLNATKGIISYKIENPFQSSGSDASPLRTVVLYSSMGTLTSGERSLWNSLLDYPKAPETLVIKRLVETVQFQRKQVQDLKAAEMQIASATLQSERRRHSEVEHERSAAIATLMEQLSEEGEQRASLEEENSKLRTVLAELQNQSDEVLNYFKKVDKDVTFSDGVGNALKKVELHFEEIRQRDEEKIQEQHEKLEETEARLRATENIAEERLRKSRDLEYMNKRLEAELRSFKEGLHDLPSTGLSPETPVPEENLAHERDDLQYQLREMEREVEQLKSALRASRAEQNKVNDALLSMNVELEDSKRRFNALRKQRDSAERKHRDVMLSAASDRDRFYKFQSEMSENFANAVNEIEERQTQICRLQNELDDRHKAFQAQESTVAQLQEQLQVITDSVIEQRGVNREGNSEDEKEKSLSATVVKSMREEVAKAQALLKQRGEEIEGLKQQIYSKDELLASVQLECTKLRTAASVRKITSRMSQGPSARMEQHQSAFLRRLSEKLRGQPREDGEVLKRLTERIDVLSKEKGKFEDVKKTLVDEVKQREHALHALRAEMAAEIATLKADVRHQETLRMRAQDDRKALEKKCHELLDTRKNSGRESYGDVTSSSLGFRDWSLAEDCDGESRRGSVYSTIRDEDGVRWKDPIIEGAVRSLNALIGTKDELWARNRELKEKLENILKNMGISDEDGKRIRSLIMQSKDFQDELTRIVDMQQDILGNITGSALEGDQAVVDDTLPYLRTELSPRHKTTGDSQRESQTNNAGNDTSFSIPYTNESIPALQKTRGEAAQFLREQLNETRALCNEKLKVNVQLCGVINELRQEVKHLTVSKSDLQSALSGMKETHEEFVSRLALLTGTEQSAVAIEDSMRTVMHNVAQLSNRFAAHKDRENSLTRRVTCLIAQKHVLAHIIDIYQSKYKLDFLAATSTSESSLGRFRKCVTSVIALGKMSRFSSNGSNKSMNTPEAVLYDVPAMAAIGRYRTDTASLHSAVIAVKAMPRLERALVEKNGEVDKLQASVKDLERSLAVLSKSAPSVNQELPTSFLYKDDMLNRKNDMARRMRDVIQEKEDLDDRLSREKQARIAAEARSTRYLDKLSILKRKLTKTVTNAESKERTYKAAIMYLKGKAEKANDNRGELDENVDPCSGGREFYGLTENKTSKRKQSHAESRAVLEQELENAEIELAHLEAGSDEYEKKSQYIKGLYGGIQRLGKPMLLDHSARAAVSDHGDQPAR